MTLHDVKAFVELVQDVRRLQRYYRQTLDSTARRELPPLELQLDQAAAELANVLAAELAAVPPEPAAAEEGGAS